MTENGDRERMAEQIAVLETRIKHLSNDLTLTRDEYEASMNRYHEIYATLEQKVSERTAELARTNRELQKQSIQRRRAEIQLQQTQKMKAIGTLAGGIAHDFNNILAAIFGYTEMAMLDLKGDAAVSRRLSNVLKACTRAKELVLQILTFSRQTDAEVRPMAPLPIIKETVKLLRATLPATISIDTRLPPQVPMIMADPMHLHQVLMNLCTNAQHAMNDSGGRLIIAVEAVSRGPEEDGQGDDLLPGQYLKLIVKDTGCGMTPEVLERVFDPYFTTKGRGDGAGLGLAVVHGIVHRHGGSIRIQSRPLQGTTAEVLLPVIEPKEDAPPVMPSGPLAGAQERILLVDDEQALVEVGQQLLERLGYTVAARTSSIEALEAFRANPDRFDLVITDQTMPNMTGIELTRELLQIRPSLPVILCTGFSEVISPEKAMAVGVREFAFKPIALRDLAETIRRVLNPTPLSGS